MRRSERIQARQGFTLHGSGPRSTSGVPIQVPVTRSISKAPAPPLQTLSSSGTLQPESTARPGYKSPNLLEDWTIAPPRSPIKAGPQATGQEGCYCPTGCPCSAGKKCTCGDDIQWTCYTCGRCINRCVSPCKPTRRKATSKPEVLPPPSKPERNPSEERRHHDRSRKREQRASETHEQRESRLQNRREIRAQKAREASSEERLAQREYERCRKNEQRAYIRKNETPQEREIRLHKRREYEAHFYGEAVEEKRKQRTGDDIREYERNQKKEQRARETSEQRERRLQKMRDYSASRRENKTSTISDKVKEATRQRIAALKASRTVISSPWDGKVDDPRKWKECCEKDMEAKLASGLWKRTYGNHMVAIDPDNLQWHCTAGAKCLCQFEQKCPKCRRYFYGCTAPCPNVNCDWKGPTNPNLRQKK